MKKNFKNVFYILKQVPSYFSWFEECCNTFFAVKAPKIVLDLTWSLGWENNNQILFLGELFLWASKYQTCDQLNYYLLMIAQRFLGKAKNKHLYLKLIWWTFE